MYKSIFFIAIISMSSAGIIHKSISINHAPIIPVVTKVISAPVVHKVVAAPVVTKVISTPVVHKVVAAPVVTKVISAPIVHKYVSTPIVHKVVAHQPAVITKYIAPAPILTKVVAPIRIAKTKTIFL